jgi:PRTRC genetic system protein E
MTMFEELYALATTATLTMSLSADAACGRLTVNVVPRPRQGAGEPALTQALSLTVTPQEFDAGFVEALRRYRAVRQEQKGRACGDTGRIRQEGQ